MILVLEDEINSLIQLIIPEEEQLSTKMVSDEKFSEDSRDLNGQSDLLNGKLVDDPSDAHQDLAPCSLCGRKFLSNRLEKHLIICSKIKEKKRKLFDAAKQRAENLDKINNHPMDIQIPEPETPPTAKPRSINKNKQTKSKTQIPPQPKNNSKQQQSNWRQQHQEFIRTIRAARGAPLIQDDDEEEMAPNSGTGQLPPGITECPTCLRRFSIKAAERHIQWCGENAKKQKETKNSNEQKKNQEALERMKARTKYKPLLPGAGNNQKVGNQDSVQKRTRSLPRASTKNNPSTTTLSASSNESSNKSKASMIKDKSKNQNNLVGRGISKVKSKSSENVATKTNSNSNYNNGNQKSLMIKSLSPSVSRRTISKKSTNSNNHSLAMVTSKVDSGMERHGRNRNGHQADGGGGAGQTNKTTRNGEKSAPIMKFKEKFPNHHYQNNVRSIIDQFQDIEHILRRNSTAIYDDSPKTVPGVRTGGISPTKNQRTPTRNGDLLKSPNMSKSDTNLHRIDDHDHNDDDDDGGQNDTDIKKRIDQYINHLYDNSHNNNNGEFTMANGLNGLGSRLIGYGTLGNNNSNIAVANHQNYQRIIGPNEDRLILHQTIQQQQQQQQQQPLQSTRQNSANSEEARMSTSDSTDSGLGVIFASANGNSSQLLETVNEDGKHSSGISVGVGSIGTNGNSEGRSSKHSARTFRADVLSPTMSDIETNNRLILRNSSLNDIELLNGDLMLGPNGTSIMDTKFQGLSENRPRFCHQCGTKYPNVMAKFCYECGSRRFETV